jgi:hypothetical protein
MRKIILAFFITFVTFLTCNSQTIKVEKVLFGHKFTQNGNKLTMSDLFEKMESNNNALKLMKSAKLNNIISIILGTAGGALVGYQIGTFITGGNPNWPLAGLGAGLAGISVPFSSSSDRKTKDAIELYNLELNSTSSYEFDPKFKIITNTNGIGLIMVF